MSIYKNLKIKMKKDFDQWNEKKKKIDAKQEQLFFKQGEIWWVNFGCNVGYEMDGKGVEYTRPAIIIKKYNKFSFLAIPLSTARKTNFYKISVGIIAGKEAVANLSQIKNIDSRRLVKKVGHLNAAIFEEVKKKASLVNFG